VSGAMYLDCTKYSTEGGVLRIEINIQCLVNQITLQAKIPIKGSRHSVNGGVLVIEIVPDVESILNTVLSR
jgi:hypothetical protein